MSAVLRRVGVVRARSRGASYRAVWRAARRFAEGLRRAFDIVEIVGPAMRGPKISR